jgi:hypothetical protein
MGFLRRNMSKSKLIGKWFTMWNKLGKIEYVSMVLDEVAQNLFMTVRFAGSGELVMVTRKASFFDATRWFEESWEIAEVYTEFETSRFTDEQWAKMGDLCDFAADPRAYEHLEAEVAKGLWTVDGKAGV